MKTVSLSHPSICSDEGSSPPNSYNLCLTLVKMVVSVNGSKTQYWGRNESSRMGGCSGWSSYQWQMIYNHIRFFGRRVCPGWWGGEQQANNSDVSQGFRKFSPSIWGEGWVVGTSKHSVPDFLQRAWKWPQNRRFPIQSLFLVPDIRNQELFQSFSEKTHQPAKETLSFVVFVAI